MGVLTKVLKLLKPSENDYYNQQTEQTENWDKIDKFAEESTKSLTEEDVARIVRTERGEL